MTLVHQAERQLSAELLRRIPLLAHLSDAELSELAQVMRVTRFNRQDTVLSKGDTSDRLLFLLHGRLQVVDYTKNGREIGLNVIEEGAFFGELTLLDNHPRSATVVAMAPSAVASLPKAPALKLIYGNPGVAEKMFSHFAQSIRRLSSFRALLAIPSANQRVYAFLCQAKQRAPDQSGTEVIENVPTQQQIAIMMNTSRETVSRVIGDLVRRGILQKNARTIVIHRPQQLEALASEEH